MTKEKLEKAAREYCRIMGINPDQQVSHGGNDGGQWGYLSPRWMLVMPEIKAQWARNEAIKFASQ